MKMLRWQPRRLVKFTCGFVTLCVIVLIIHTIKTVWDDNKCSVEESHTLLEDVCVRYRDHSVAGSLCGDLCDTNTISFVKCTNYRRGKKVLVMECNGGCEAGETVKVVMKTKNKIDEEYDHLVLPLHDDGTVTMDGLEMAKILMVNKAYGDMHFTVSSNQNIFSELWSMDYDKYVKSATYKNADHVALLNIWSLLQQDEYLFMKVYQNVPYVPRLYGTCGEFYFMEYAPPGDVLSPGFFVKSPWSKRADAALKLMDLAQSLDTDFYQPIHFCDVKVDNFGVGMSDLKVKILDSDSIFFDERMSMNLRGPCTDHYECDFFDCRGWCEVNNRTCNGRRVNNNLQNICEDIFIDRPPNFFGGLLREAPTAIAGELATVLQDCAYPNKNMGKVVRTPTPRETMEKLYKLLQTKTE